MCVDLHMRPGATEIDRRGPWTDHEFIHSYIMYANKSPVFASKRNKQDHAGLETDLEDTRQIQRSLN